MIERLAPYIVILSWLLVQLSVIVCVFAFMAALGAFYRPNSPHAPYMPYVLPGSIGFLLCALVLAVRFTIKRKTGNRTGFVKELGGLLLATALAAVVMFVAVPPVPAHFTQHVGQTPYRIPSVYTSIRDTKPGSRSGVTIDFCLNSWAGYYESFFRSCDRSFIMLSALPLVQHFDASYLLNHVLKIPHEDGRILDRAALKAKTTDIPRYRWTGYSTGRYHMVLDKDDRLTLVAKCIRTRPYCHIYSDTPRGVLHFEYREGDDFQYANWMARERRIFELIDSWQESR